MPAPEAIFKPAVPGEAVATLVLIENSEAMTHLWPDLRDHHIPTLLGTMRMANPIVPIQVLWLITSPVNNSDSPSSRNDRQLPNMQFDFSPSNKITPAIVDKGINFLASVFKNQPAARHLILVAASSPFESCTDANGVAFKWQDLAKKFHQERIYLHLILNPTQNMSLFSTLFYDSLGRQGHQEIRPWFSANFTKYQFHLAGIAFNSVSLCESDTDVITEIPYTQMLNLPDHPPLQRNYTYPPDPVGNSHELNSASVGQEDKTTPTLVTRLQQMHGLTKKRIYRSQPVREPFVRDAPRGRYSQPPVALSIPPLPPLSNMNTSPSADTRVPSKTKPDRLRRLSAKGPLNISPPEPIGGAPPRNSWFRRSSRAVLPTDLGTGSYPSSPTSVSSYSANSPVLPTPSEVDPIAAGTVNLVSAPWEPSWLRDQTEQYSSTTTMHDDALLYNHAFDQGNIPPAYSGYPVQAQAPPIPQPFTAQDHYTSTGTSSFISRNKVLIDQPALPDDGDKPFILCPEYEAAATARFRAIFQTPAGKTDIPQMNLYQDAGSMNPPSAYYTSLSARQPPLASLANFSYVQDPQHAVPPSSISQLSSITTQGSSVPQTSGTSSLEGWNGQYSK